MTGYSHDDDDVAVIIGSGPGGATLALALVRAGRKVVLLEAGPWIDPDDFVNDERIAYQQLTWTDPRLATGDWSLARDFPASPAWMGKGVGGTSLFWTGLTPRFKRHEVRAASTYGRVPGTSLRDWPVDLDDLDERYEEAERAMGTSHRQGRPPMPANNNYKVLANGAKAIGYEHYATGPYATNVEPYDGRPGTLQDGFCQQGDKSRAKWNPSVSEIPKALATGLLDLRTEARAVQITIGRDGRADGVVYADRTGLHRQRAALVSVAGNAIETPRLLLLSATTGHPDGLANSSGLVGRNYMRHTTGVVYAEFPDEVHMYRGEPMAGIVNDESRHDPSRGFAGGYYLEMIAQGLPSFSTFMEPGGWGPEFTSKIEAYTRTAAIWICGEDMPQESNRVTLSGAVLDDLGLPVPEVHYDDHPNDLAMRRHGYEQAEKLFRAVGAVRTTRAPAMPSGHNMGTARMSDDPAAGVVDGYGRSHDIPNLFVSDGSLFTTSAAANPTLTIMALVLRQADHILTTGVADRVPAATREGAHR
ncbi:GMC family oxidoreductase [Herbiconiux solani]|uniref:GMC family oxidoreductase n=1 Tax=Herbiconiux solani TaxID=661329 RepID=UPI0008257EEA|nr:GMC family oxidoreductase [Herbiconiux solani]